MLQWITSRFGEILKRPKPAANQSDDGGWKAKESHLPTDALNNYYPIMSDESDVRVMCVRSPKLKLSC